MLISQGNPKFQQAGDGWALAKRSNPSISRAKLESSITVKPVSRLMLLCVRSELSSVFADFTTWTEDRCVNLEVTRTAEIISTKMRDAHEQCEPLTQVLLQTFRVNWWPHCSRLSTICANHVQRMLWVLRSGTDEFIVQRSWNLRKWRQTVRWAS